MFVSNVDPLPHGLAWLDLQCVKLLRHTLQSPSTAFFFSNHLVKCVEQLFSVLQYSLLSSYSSQNNHFSEPVPRVQCFWTFLLLSALRLVHGKVKTRQWGTYWLPVWMGKNMYHGGTLSPWYCCTISHFLSGFCANMKTFHAAVWTMSVNFYDYANEKCGIASYLFS